MKKIAIMDIGSNNSRLILVYIYDNGSYRIADQLKEPVRLISDMGHDNIIKPRRIQQLIKTIHMFKRLCVANGIEQIYAYCSAAVNRAANQRSFLDEVYATTQINLEVLTGEREATLVFQGVINTMDVDSGVIMDIGGGTTQLVHFEKRQIKDLACLPFGTVSLTELFGLADKVKQEQIDAIEDFYKKQLESVPWLANIEGLPIIGVGGSFRNLGKIMRMKSKKDIGTLHNYNIRAKEIDAVYENMCRLDLDRRMKIKGLSNERADIFLAAFAAIKTTVNYIGCSDIFISCNGLREGIMFNEIDPQLAVKPVQHVLDFSLKNALGLFQENVEHANNVSKLSLLMFEQLRQLHKLPNSYMRIIKTAATLHDIGATIKYHDHHKHSFYLILNSNIYGLTHREHLMSAFVALAHRKDDVKKECQRYSDMINSDDLMIIYRLAVLVRIAESFDRAMDGIVETVSCDILGDSVIMKTQATGDASLEIKDALTCSEMFKKAYGKNLVIL